MSASFVLIAGCALVTFAIKATGPVLLGGRSLPPIFDAVIALLAPALLAALVVTQAFADGDHWQIGDRTAGVLAGGLVVWRGGSVIVGVIVAAALTAALRAFV